jgi:hypothetical protein
MKLLPVIATALVATLALPAAAADPSAARVYQQRTADGSILLTDRPLDNARTERTWSVEREDPAAARARSERVQREADAVAARIDRRIAADEERLRQQYTGRSHDTSTSDDNDVVYGGYGYGYPGGYAAAQALAHGKGHGHGHDHRRHHMKTESTLGLGFGPPPKRGPIMSPFVSPRP